MKNLLLIAFATLALSLGANVVNACPACEGKKVVNAEKKADKAEKKDADADKAAADTKEAKAVTDTKTTKACTNCSGTNKRASAGQLVKADRDATGACGKAAGCGGGCGSDCGGCGSGCGDGGCDTAKAKKETKTVKN